MVLLGGLGLLIAEAAAGLARLVVGYGRLRLRLRLGSRLGDFVSYILRRGG